MNVQNLVSRSRSTGRETTTFVAHQTIAYAPAATLAPVNFFLSGSQAREYQNWHTGEFQDRDVVFTHVKAHHNMVFNVTSGLEAMTQQRFEDRSYFSYKLLDTSYPDIPLTFPLPYELVQQGTSTIVKDKLNQFLELLDPIVIPKGTRAEFTFTPAAGLTLPASAATNPTVPGYLPAFASDRAYSVDVWFYGWTDRPR